MQISPDGNATLRFHDFALAKCRRVKRSEMGINMHNKKKKLLVAVSVIMVLVILLIGAFEITKAIGKKRLQSRMVTSPGRVKYQNTLYEYNDDILTFLVMGIDKGKETFEPWEIDDGNSGQADALFLTVLDTTGKTIKVIGINRNTMTDIDFYDEESNYLTTFPAQIALQYAYGNNREESCAYQLETVKKLFYNLPIHGYAAVNIDAVPVINDTVGGVDVEVLEDLTRADESLVKGRQIHLIGESAYWYVKYRDINLFASVDMRTMRQAQYLDGFIEAATHSVKSNPFVALQLYHEIAPQMTTDLSFPEILYLASILPQYQFDEQSFHQVTGITAMGEEYEEFYPDEATLFELILDIFYIENEN